MSKSAESNSKAVIAEKLGAVLASTYMLRLKTQNFHWNVTGPHFGSLHQLFEEQYQELATAVDEVAERIRALGKFSPGSFQQFSNLSKIKDAPVDPPAYQSMISILQEDHEAISRLCTDVSTFADENGDPATGDLMNGRITSHEKTAWMLRSHLQ